MIPWYVWLFIGLLGLFLFFIVDPLDFVYGIGTVVEAIVALIGFYKTIKTSLEA